MALTRSVALALVAAVALAGCFFDTRYLTAGPGDAGSDSATPGTDATVPADGGPQTDAGPVSDSGMPCVGFGYRRSVTVIAASIAGTTDLSDFPLLVAADITPDLRDVPNGGHVAHADGYDIWFEGMGSALDHELEVYDGNAGRLRAWVRVPVLFATANTELYLYYGNAAVTSSMENTPGVWNSSYAGVWHMAESPSGMAPQMLDSTTNMNHGTTMGAMTAADLVQGKVGRGIDLDGSDDRIDVGNGSSLDLTASITLSAWINLNVAQASMEPWARIIDKWGGTAGGYGLFFLSMNEGIRVETADGSGNDSISANYTFAPGTWYYVVGVWQPSDTGGLYVDGMSVNGEATFTTFINSIAGPVQLGGTTNYRLNARLDEVRISNTPRSAGRIATEYANIDAPTSFAVVGPEESGCFLGP